jgi:hypothetical protein
VACCAGVQVQFLLPSTDTPWQKAEELGWKDRIAMKVDSRNPYQYAPNGLQLTKVKYSRNPYQYAPNGLQLTKVKASQKSIRGCPFERYRTVHLKGTVTAGTLTLSVQWTVSIANQKKW